MSLEINETTTNIIAKKEIDGNKFINFEVGDSFTFTYTKAKDGIAKSKSYTIKAGDSGYIKFIYKLIKEV